MGGAVSSGRDNNELVDNLMGSNYIRSRMVERVFRVLDRADYMTPEARDQAYRDLAWRNGPLHLSAPCIYSEVMEGLELRPGVSFLNIGSGTGYLSTMAGLIIGSGGISHGIEVHPMVVEYSTKKLSQFIENSPTLDEFDFCEPKYFCGNGLCLAPLQAAYDRVYCGAGCPDEYHNYMKQLIKVGGVLVMPLNDNLIQMRRVSETEWSSRNLHHVSFATLRVPTKEETGNLIKLEDLTPPRLQVLARGVVRTCMRKSLQSRHPELREPPPRQQTARPACPRRICIPIEDDSDVEGLNALHDLDRASGANEMNALLSLVLSMGHNRVAGALRFDSMDSHSDSSSDDDADDADDAPGDDAGGGGGGGGGDGADGGGGGGGGGSDSGGGGGSGGGGTRGGPPTTRTGPMTWLENGDLPPRTCRGVLTLEFQDAPQPIINVSRQPPDIVISNTDSTTVVTTGFKTNSSTMTDGTNSNLETDDPKTEEESTSTTDNAVADGGTTDTGSVSAAENPAPGNDNPKTKGRKSKITLKKTKTDTKILKTETDGTKTETRGDTDKKTDKGEANKKPGEPKRKMPAEVEIYLAGKDGVGTSYRTEMDWEDTVEIEIETSGEESTETSKESDPQKLDSGIGEENSPTSTSGSSLEKTETNEDSEMDAPSDSVNVDADGEGRQRQQKRGHGQLGTRSTSSTEAEESGAEGGGGAAAMRRRFKRRATPGIPGRSPTQPVPGPDARRVRLSIMMKRGVKELPLPYALKKYVNYGRCFQF